MYLQGIVAINLANQHGSEGVLSSAFKEEANRYTAKASGLKLVPFDFHKQCGATRYDRYVSSQSPHKPLKAAAILLLCQFPASCLTNMASALINLS